MQDGDTGKRDNWSAVAPAGEESMKMISYKRRKIARKPKRLTVIGLTLAIALGASTAPAQDKGGSPSRSEYDSYLKKLLITAEAKCSVPAKGWSGMRAQIMQGLKRTLGEDLPREWPSLNPRVEGVVARRGYRIEQVSAEFWPGVRYAMQVFVPDGPGPFPTVLLVSYGSPLSETRGAGPREPLFQQFGGGLARMGILTVSFLPLGKGVVPEAYKYNGIALLAGTSIAQEQFQTGRRALDYLLTRRDVDSKRVGITGASDGGWVTLYVATFDRRVTAAAPAATNYTFSGLLLPRIWKIFDEAEGNAPEVLTYGANIPTLTAANAPKWVRFLNCELEGDRLQYIPVIDGAAKAAYELAGVPERYSSHLSYCDHSYCPEMQVEAISWFSELFFGRRPAQGALTLRRVPNYEFERHRRVGSLHRLQDLLVSKDGQAPEPIEIIPPEDKDWNRLKVGDLEDDGGKQAFLKIIEVRRQDARRARAAMTKDTGRLIKEVAHCLGIDALRMGLQVRSEGNAVVLETEPGLRTHGQWIEPVTDKAKTVYLVVGSAADRAALTDLPAAARFDLSLREETSLGKATWALVMLNRPPIGMWAWDAMSAAHWLESQGAQKIELVGVGDTGAIVALLAGVLSPEVNSVSLERNRVRSLDKDIVERQTPETPYWAHRLLWVTDLPEMISVLKSQGRWGAGA
jgi:dienelactone hydrolase